MVEGDKIAIAVHKGNDELRNKLNAALKEIIADGTYKRSTTSTSRSASIDPDVPGRRSHLAAPTLSKACRDMNSYP